jgi:hypothetical protein
LSTYAIPLSASIPVMIGDDALLGTAIGVWKAFVSDFLDVAKRAWADSQG